MNLLSFIGYLFVLLNKLKNRCISRYNTYILFRGSERGTGSIGANVIFSNPENIKIGKNTYINGGQLKASEKNKIIIGNNCLISYNVHIRTDTHNYKESFPILKQGHKYGDVIIGNDCWIGYGVQIMSGVTIADGCVIGAGAIVTKNTEPYCIYVGVPAHKIGKRN